MSKNVNIAYTLDLTRVSGLPLAIEEVAGVELHLSANNGVDFGIVTTILPSVGNHTVPELEIGTWVLRLIVVDTEGRKSTPVDTSVDVPDETNPSAVASVTITFV